MDAKRTEIVAAMKTRKARLESGDDSELLVWVISAKLATAQRPLQHHPNYAGSGAIIPKQATPLMFKWVGAVREEGIASIISFIHDRDRRCYLELDLDALDINESFEKQGFTVARIPREDPHYSKVDTTTKRKSLERCRAEPLKAFDSLQKPVLLQFSSGIDR